MRRLTSLLLLFFLLFTPVKAATDYSVVTAADQATTALQTPTEYNVVCAGQSNAVAVCSRLQTKMEAEFLLDDVTTINTAVGGTDMAEWQKGGDLYADMLEAVNGREIDLVVFWQGEGNTQNEAEANEWHAGMLQLIADFRTDFGSTVPIIIVQIGSDPDPSKATYKYWYHVWSAQQWFDGTALFGSTPQYRVKLIPTWDIPRDVPGGVHHTNGGYNTVANRIIAKFKNMLGLAFDTLKFNQMLYNLWRAEFSAFKIIPQGA